jgi:hypothetical protein
LLAPFAMYVPLARSDYYGASAHIRDHQPATDLPTTVLDGRGEGDHGWFPRSPRTRSAREVPSSTPTASPRLRRRPSPWPPHRNRKPASELIPTTGQGPRAAHRPISTRFESARLLRSVNRWFTLVTPSGLARQARTVWQYRHVPPLSGLLSTLSGAPRIRLPPASPDRCDGPAVQVFHLHSIA